MNHELKGTSNNYKLVIPAPYQARDKLHRESNYFAPSKAGLDSRFRRNDIFRDSLSIHNS